MTPLAKMVPTNVENDDDVPNVSSEFETGAGRRVNLRKFNREHYKISNINVLLDQLVDVEIPLREAGTNHVNSLNQLFLERGMDYSLAIISATPLREHGKKVSEVVVLEDDTEVLEPSGRLGLVYGRHRRLLIAVIKEEYPDTTEPHAWAQRRIKVVVIIRKDDEFINDREIIIKSKKKKEAAKVTKVEHTFLDQLKKVVNESRMLEK